MTYMVMRGNGMWHNTKNAERAIGKINQATEWHAVIYQNRYAELSEGRNQKEKEK